MHGSPLPGRGGHRAGAAAGAVSDADCGTARAGCGAVVCDLLMVRSETSLDAGFEVGPDEGAGAARITGCVRLVGARTASACSISAINSPAASTASQRGISTPLFILAIGFKSNA